MQLGQADLAEKLHKKEKKSKKDKSGSSSSKSKKHKKEKKKKHKKDKKEAKKYGIASSDSDSSSHKSSGSNSSYSSGEARFVQWASNSDSRKRKITQGQLLKFQTLRFKKRGDLLTFATRYPGALVMHLISQARGKAGLSTARTVGAMMETDLARWAEHSGLKEVRDQREVQFLAKLITTVGSKRLPEAMDLLAMRIREVLLAKKEGQSWDKAAVVALTPGALGPAAAVPDLGLML